MKNFLGNLRPVHLFLRGNFQNIMFYDKLDKINVWNRLWLAAASTGVQILSVAILDNHFHITAMIRKDNDEAAFMHFFRMSITHYHNHRYSRSGILGTRKFGRAILKDDDDLMDCICYHARNVLHHRILDDFINYPFSTVRCIFGLQKIDPDSCYNTKTLPHSVARKYMPAKRILPAGWLMTQQGMIIPPQSVFRADILEFLFQTKSEYLETLSHQTRREKEDCDIPVAQSVGNLGTPSEQISEFVLANTHTPIPSMTPGQKMEAICMIRNAFPKVSFRFLSRLFDIPQSTLRYRMKKWLTHR